MTKGQPISTQLCGGHQERLEIDAAELRVVSGPDRGLRIPLGAHSLRIGSSGECDVTLHDPAVSARHAEIAPAATGYLVRDLGSKNGVQLGGWTILRAPLADGMRLKLGETTLLVRALGERRTIPLARVGRFGDLPAYSLQMRAVVATLEQLATSEITVLIEGETGTGKEVAAQALHAASTRSSGPFVVFDCAAVGPSLLASELFGHEKGAFTGADAARAGLLEEANGGTLFLDEIGELPRELQPALLGAIERKASRRVGGNHDIAHDVRIVAATHRNLGEEVRAKRFREDLYFRLAVARVRLPPLRERPEDIAVLAQLFAAETGATLTPELLALFATYEWPGNVRELRNTLARLAAQPEQPPLAAREAADGGLGWHEERRLAEEAFERRQVARLLAHAGGHLAQAAEAGGISRQFLHRLATKYNLRPRDPAKR